MNARVRLERLLGIELPIIQAPMAGAQGVNLAVAVSNAGGLGSLPCALLSREALKSELAALAAGTERPFNLNFFCHTPPEPAPEREQAWRELLAPYYRELGLDTGAVPMGPARTAFDLAQAEALVAHPPGVVSFHFGLPSRELLDRVRSLGCKIMASATSVAEGRWLEARGVDAIIAQGLEAGGDFSPLWAGQNVSGCKEVAAAELTRELVSQV
jgi:nitronate monooxygenase